MTPEPIAAVELARISVVQLLHRGGQDAITHFENYVVVRGHETEADAFELEVGGHASQATEKVEPVDIVSVVPR